MRALLLPVVLLITQLTVPGGVTYAGGTEAATRLGVDGTRFTVNGRPVLLLGVSYYGALGAAEETARADLREMQRLGFNWIRLWANWNAFGQEAAVDVEGRPVRAGLDRLRRLMDFCDREGIVVDVTLSRGNGVTGPPRLQSLAAHRRAVETLCTELKEFPNWYLDLANERNIADKRFVRFADLKGLRELARQLDPRRLVTASHAGDIADKDLAEYVRTVGVDFLSPHRPRGPESPGQTETRTRQYLKALARLGRVVPVHYQEPFRRDFGKYNPDAAAFLTDLRGAVEGGAAGWCFHNGDRRDAKDGRPRRSFDLRDGSLFGQLDDVERAVVRQAQDAAGGAQGR